MVNFASPHTCYCTWSPFVDCRKLPPEQKQILYHACFTGPDRLSTTPCGDMTDIFWSYFVFWRSNDLNPITTLLWSPPAPEGNIWLLAALASSGRDYQRGNVGFLKDNKTHPITAAVKPIQRYKEPKPLHKAGRELQTGVMLLSGFLNLNTFNFHSSHLIFC